MKVIIAGSRTIEDYEYVKDVIKRSNFTITEVVCGKASRGVDALGERYAIENDIPVKPFYANWKKFGKAAGMMRNNDMADYAEAIIAIWDGSSRGTKDMIKKSSNLMLFYDIYKGEKNGITDH